jgi:cellulose synthase/poly-beta-1,6-N-acetylglucosamine synthase-like glycosyltransferase/peptidoglycan/xylan/chitin deacetylase (PgdA/CDA1 family)
MSASAGRKNDRTPVFYDASGKRGRRMLVGIVSLVMLVVGFAGWVIPQAASPVRTEDDNQGIAYVHKLAASPEFRDIPVVGGEGADSLVRIAKIVRKNGSMYLTDPFDNTVFRKATDDEKSRVGSRNYVIEWYGHPADHQLVLTFDDGPDVRNTPRILDILSHEHVRATFFVIGNNVVRYPELFRRELREGHAAGNHTLDHIGFNHGVLVDREEMIGADRIMRAAGGYATRFFRIPEGDPDHSALAVLQAQQFGYLCLDMDYDTNDWRYGSGQTIPFPELDGKGHVVLMHDGGADRASTIKQLPEFIKMAKSKGYTFVTPDSFVPKQYAPIKNVSPTLADQATWFGMWGLVKLPGETIKFLFWFGVISLAAMSVLYVTLALISHWLYRRRNWQEPDKKRMPFVTIGIPAYNEEHSIRSVLDALVLSDYPANKMEIIVVDDGSTDKTLSLLRSYAKLNKVAGRLRVIHQANKGKWAALNRIFKAAKGGVVVTLDGDTLFEPQTVRMLVRHFADPKVGAVAGYVKVGNRHGVLTVWQSLEYVLGTGIDRTAGGLVNGILIVPGACSAWRRKAVQGVGGFSRDTMAEDCDATLAIFKNGFKIIQENQAVALTEAPTTITTLAKQRKRWMFGNFQAFFKHRNVLFRPRYGTLGMVILPYTLVSIMLPLIFMPFAYALVLLNILSGDWFGLIIFASVVTMIYMLITMIALLTVHERPWHLLIVPFYRIIYEPLRTYLLYAAFFKAVRGKTTKWYTPPRQGLARRPPRPKFHWKQLI